MSPANNPDPKMPGREKYKPYHEQFETRLPDRTWPDQLILKSPAWCSVDLRDGNQALRCPMSVERKLEFYKTLLDVGFRQIEIGYPAASEVEREFARALIEEQRIPVGVKPQVLTATREDLVRATLASIRGGPETIVHVYNSTSKTQREKVFRMSKDETMERAVLATKLVRSLSNMGDVPVHYQYSPESFTATERNFALDVCNAVIEAWEPRHDSPIIINLPSTVELSTPNAYADLIEWMSRGLKHRDRVVLSVHPHNDRGTSVAAAELALMAGAQRVEGTVFGFGERAGNCDLVQLAENIRIGFGVDHNLDLRDIPHLRAVYERCTGEVVPHRHPVAGDSAYVAYSGTHQLAISRCLEERRASGNVAWDISYLPRDPEDVGMSYKPIVINSQSGRNGQMWVFREELKMDIPKWMEASVTEAVQTWCNATGQDASPEKMRSLFDARFVFTKGPFHLRSLKHLEPSVPSDFVEVELQLAVNDRIVTERGRGNGLMSAAANALKPLGVEVNVLDYSSDALGTGSEASAIAYVRLRCDGKEAFGAGINTNTELVGVEAMISAVNSVRGRTAS